jgi:hypothetical protein
LKRLRGFGIALAIAAIAFSLFPVPAFANHGSTYVLAEVAVWHSSFTQAFYTSQATDCGSTGYAVSDPCPVTVSIDNHRDSNRYVRWGGTPAVFGSVNNGQSSQVLALFIPAHSTWYISVSVGLCSTSACTAFQADDSIMFFTVTVEML